MSAIEEPAQLAARDLGGKRVLQDLALLTMRGVSTVAKFLLAIYTARYLGLSDLGIYGLLTGATNIVPAIFGLGMTAWVVRKLVDLPRAEALPLISSRLGLILLIHLVLQPLVFMADILLGEPIPLAIAVLCGAILLLDNLANEAGDMLLARRRVLFAYLVIFLRAGAWPIPVMAIGLIYPATRTLEFLLVGWLAMLVVCWLIMAAFVLRQERWRYLRPRVRGLLRDLCGGLNLYIKDLSSIGMFFDRFLISMFLGLELTGVYTLFWSIANVVHSLAVYGVLQARLPHIIATARTADPSGFRALERNLQIQIGTWALLLTLGAAIVTPLMIPFLDQPLVQDYLPIFFVILFATLLRTAADGYGYALLALHQDRAIAIIALGGAIAAAVLNLILTPLAGLWGASAAYALTSGGLFAARYFFSRFGRSPLASIRRTAEVR
jgi:O-antigen/teichoic acid export membrane protein